MSKEIEVKGSQLATYIVSKYNWFDKFFDTNFSWLNKWTKSEIILFGIVIATVIAFANKSINNVEGYTHYYFLGVMVSYFIFNFIYIFKVQNKKLRAIDFWIINNKDRINEWIQQDFYIIKTTYNKKYLLDKFDLDI